MAAARPRKYGTALVVSGPSGVGKSTVCAEVLRRRPDLHFSVSCTTRAPRPGETDGVQYHFLSPADFERRVAAREFLEHAEVHGNRYGTLRREVETYVCRGHDVLLDIDVQGARQIRAGAGGSELDRCVEYVFLGPPSFAEMERRLRARGTDSDEAIRRRLRNARRELPAWREYEHLVINDVLQTAVDDVLAILRAAACETGRRTTSPWPGIRRAAT